MCYRMLNLTPEIIKIESQQKKESQMILHTSLD